MNDNDILVKREDSLKAWCLLQQEGFTHELIKSPLHNKIVCDLGKHLPCLYKNGYAIEIHHRLFDYKTDLSENADPIDSAIEVDISDTKAWILSKKVQQMHLIDHYERHAMEGICQLRLYADILLLDKTSLISIPDSFISNPQQENKPQYRKAAYKIAIGSIPIKYRLRYIIGDIFPSVKWMQERYKCNAFKALLYYPLRMGKLLWII